MSKIITRVLSVLLIVVMAFPNVAFASDQGNGQTEQYSEVISIQASETVGPDTKYPESLSKAPNYSDFSTKLEIIDYSQNGPKSFFAGCDTITADELLAKSQYVFTTKAGDVTGTFTSARLDTGTPGVTWDYTVNYTITPMPSGTGWYFKSVSCTVSAYKGFLFYTWATVGLLEFTSATYTLSPSTRPTSITLNMTLQFQIWTDATGPNPVTYSESHSHTTKVSNIYN